jgi:glycosyltransferase involved in cell wall biosynthesis
VAEEVHLVGGLAREDVVARLRAADVLLHASLVEGIPNTVLEAMACELPVVASDCGGMREAVTDGVEGFLVAPREVHALAGALARLARDPALGRRMGRAGRARVEDAFSPAREREAFLRLYRDVVGRHAEATA